MSSCLPPPPPYSEHTPLVRNRATNVVVVQPRTKPSGCATAALFIVFFAIFSLFQRWWSENYAFMCASPNSHESAVLTPYSFEPELYPNLHLRLGESVFGHVTIKEADDYHTRAIIVTVQVKPP